MAVRRQFKTVKEAECYRKKHKLVKARPYEHVVHGTFYPKITTKRR